MISPHLELLIVTSGECKTDRCIVKPQHRCSHRKKETSSSQCERACRQNVPWQKSCKLLPGGCRIRHHRPSLMLEHVAQHTNAAEYNAYQCLQFLLAGSQLPPAHVFWSAPSFSNREVENQTARTLSCHLQIAPSRPKTAYHETPGSQWQTRRCIAQPLRTKTYFPLYEARDPQRECHQVVLDTDIYC